MARARVRRETSAGGVVYRSGDDGPLYLIIRDSYANWGFPKGHLEPGEEPAAAARREVCEETGLGDVETVGPIETIDWYFRFRGQRIHKTCHFFLMVTERSRTQPQRSEGITACRWVPYERALDMIGYANAQGVLRHAHAMVAGEAA